MGVVDLINVSYKYPISSDFVIKDANLSIEKGEFCSIIGKNGAGKTTLCNIIRGFAPKFYNGELKGNVMINGKDISESGLGDLALEMGFIFQNPFTQISGVRNTVFEEIAFGLENLGVEPDEIMERVSDVIDMLNLSKIQNKHPKQLSGGQRQKVALASIIVMEPGILIIDEPTSQLDPQGTEEVFEVIKLMKEKGKTVILVEHKIDLIAKYSDRIVVMEDGKIAINGKCKDVLTNLNVKDHDAPLPTYSLLGHEMIREGLPIKEIQIDKEATEKEIRKSMGW